MASPGHSLRLPLLALLAACGPSVAPAPALDEEKIANRAAEIVLRRLQTMHGLGATASADWPADDDAAFHERLRVPTADRPARGAADPLVTLVVFSDFQCPFCSRVVPTLEQVLRAHPDDVRLVFRHNPLPFHDRAEEAAEATMEAHAQRGDAGFWAMHDLLFENQRALERADLVRYARSIGLDAARFERALDDDIHLDAIRADMAAAQRLEARGTPTFFLNGRKIVGAQPFETFEATIQEELRIAEMAMESGVPRARLYERLLAAIPATASGAAEPAPPGRAEPDPAAGAAPDEPERYQVPVPADAPRMGASQPVLVIQEISDYQCPFCSRVQPTIERIMQSYGNRVQLVWRHFPLPFHTHARLAHQAAIEIRRQRGDRAFWRYTDILFANQRALERADLEGYARQIGGVNMARFRRALDRGTHDARIEQDVEAIGQSGARIGTPSFLIGDRLLQGAQPYEVFEAAIEAELPSP